MKPVFAPAQIADVLETVLPTLDYEIDGLIATAVEPPVQMGQTDTTFKYKRGTDHTIDFLAVRPSTSHFKPAGSRETAMAFLSAMTADDPRAEMDLLAIKTGGAASGWAHWATAHVSTATQSHLAPGASSAAAVAHALHGRIVECRYDPRSESWHIENIRADKTAPNKLSTAWKTWQNVRENLSLLHVFPRDSVPDDVRERLKRWEAAHPRWQSPALPLLASSPAASSAAPSGPTPSLPPKVASSALFVPPMAPVPLQRAAQFR
jgi:hypothetical protein